LKTLAHKQKSLSLADRLELAAQLQVRVPRMKPSCAAGVLCSLGTLKVPLRSQVRSLFTELEKLKHIHNVLQLACILLNICVIICAISLHIISSTVPGHARGDGSAARAN
jgi:hypothetical protein